MNVTVAVFTLNVKEVHGTENNISLWTNVTLYFDFMPYLVTSTIFRITSLMMISTCLTTFTFIPVMGIIISSIVINEITLKGTIHKLRDHLRKTVIYQ